MTTFKALDSRDRYTVGWVAALSGERAAAMAMLDETHGKPLDFEQPHTDPNSYTWGRIGEHNVVIASLPPGAYGTTSAASTALPMVSSFPQIRIGLLVGIGAGIARPDEGRDIRLGDVAVSQPNGRSGGVIQYDLVKAKGEDIWERKDFLNRPPDVMLRALGTLQAQHKLEDSRVREFLDDALLRYPRMARSKPGYNHQGVANDRLFRSTYDHVPGRAECCHCDAGQEIRRETRDSTEAQIHYGTIASGNTLIKHAATRDRIIDVMGEECICFEMEAAGLINNFPCLVIRGICDYADSHKNDLWQEYAAATAAAYAKEFLGYVPGDELQRAQRAIDILKNIETNVKDIHTILKGHISDTRCREIEEWLSPLEPSKRHHSIRDSHLPNTGRWVLEHHDFLTWLSDSPKFPYLCCYGDPGAGKTFIASAVIDHLEHWKAATPNVGLAYIYCDFRDQALQTTENIIGAIAKQLLRQLPNPEEIATILKKSCHNKEHPQLVRKTEAFSDICNQFDRVFICVDALDECQEIPELLNCFRNVAMVRVFTTGRKFVQHFIEVYFGPTPTIHIEAKESDIQVLVKERIHEDRKKDPSLMNERLERYITEKVSALSKGIFLLPELQIRTILEERTRRRRREATDTLPPNLKEAFGSTIDRIRKQPDAWVKQADTILSWTYLVGRPLSIDELLEAYAIREGDRDLDVENFPSRKTLLQSCLGLVSIDGETSTVRLVHFSLDKYFKNTGKIISQTIPEGNENIGRACLTYLLFQSVTAESLQQALIGAKEEATAPSHVLLNYAACQWGHHIQKSGCRRRSTIDLALKYLKLSWQERAKSQMHLCNHLRIKDSGNASFSSVHIVAYFGIHQVLSELLKVSDIKVDPKDGTHGRTPLSWAAGCGHEAVVKLLLETGRVDPNLKDNWGRTPLWWAVGRGHEAVVKLLLATGRVDPNLEDRHGRLPLSLAARGGHKAVVKLLLATGRVDPDSKDRSGQTLLSHAARRGHEAVVRLLLATGRVDPDARDRYTDRTPLSLVAGSGHEAVAKLLLETGKVDADSKDRYGRTPLSWAAWGGHEAVAKLLLKTGSVEPDLKDRYGRTPLMWAACRGHEAVVGLLLQTGRANPDSKDSNHQTPLSLAAENGYKTVVDLLLATGKLDPDSKDSDDKTPLLRAAQRGHEAVVKLLLTIGRGDSEGGPGSRNALLWATGSGHEAMAELLLATGKVDPDSKDSNYQTPLARAAWSGHEEVVKLLLATGRVDPAAKDRFGQTPLSRAEDSGHEVVAKLLRGTDKVDSIWANATVDGHKAIKTDAKGRRGLGGPLGGV